MTNTQDDSVHGSAVADQVHELLEPVITSAGVELVDVEFNGGTLRVTVDAEPDPPSDEPVSGDAVSDDSAGEGSGVSTDALTTVNRLISPILDQHDPIPGRYVLEVSSPGVERPLRRPHHYERAVGETVVVKLLPGEEFRRVKGSLESFSDPTITVGVVEIDGTPLSRAETHEFDLAMVDRARTVFEWGPTPKKGGSKPGKKKQGKNNQGKKGKN